MNVLLIDQQPNFLDFAMRCKDAGHDVRWFMRKNKEGKENRAGEGIIQRVGDFEKYMKWADIIVCSDNVYFMDTLDRYRDKGAPIFGPTKETALIELDRAKGQEVFNKFGIKTIPSVEFNDYDSAIEYVKKNKKRYVSKPNGDVSKALSYVSKSPADMVYMLERWKKDPSIKKDKFILQEFVPGIEMAVGGWFGTNGFSKYYCENFEHKKLMNDDLGVNTGEMGTCLKYVKESKLCDMVLKPLESYLHAHDYTGYVDVAVIIDDKGNPWPLEFTTRPGWPLFQIQQAVHRGDPVKWMLDMIDGKDTFRPSEKIATGVVLTIPDFPYSRLTKKEVSGIPVYGLDKSNKYWEHLHPCEIMLGNAPTMVNGEVKTKEIMVTAGDYVLVSTGIGNTVKESMEMAYEVMDSIEIPNSPMYRTDIGKRLEKQLPILHKLGFATEWEY